jgi:glycosyltransferase involved in cell wall biosynthesis
MGEPSRRETTVARPACRPHCVHVVPQTHDGGAENQARYLLGGLRDLGVLELEIVYFERGRAHEQFEALGLPMRPVERRRRLLLDLVPRGRRLGALLADRPPAIMHTWLPEGNLVGLIAARRLRGTRLVISQRGGAMELRYPWHVRTQRALIHRADHGISNSTEGAQLLSRFGMDAADVSVIHNAISPARIEPTEGWAETRRRLDVPETTPVVLTVARATDRYAVEQKGFDVLLEAIARVREQVPAAVLLLLGSTAEELRRAGIELPGYVRALGYQPDPATVMNGADVLAIASRAEGHSNAAGEALLVGLPVVTTDSGDHTELVAGSGGRVVPVEEPEALSRAIVELLDDPPDRDAVRTAARPKLAIDRLISSTLHVYRALLDG